MLNMGGGAMRRVKQRGLQTSRAHAGSAPPLSRWWDPTPPQYCTAWANENERGAIWGPSFGPVKIIGLRGREQAGFGLINLAVGFHYPDGSEGWAGWPVQNLDYRSRLVGPVWCPTDRTVRGLDVFEQHNYGLVDARLVYDNGEHSDWLTNNNQERMEELRIPADKALTGIEVREQAGYGLINIRLHFL